MKYSKDEYQEAAETVSVGRFWPPPGYRALRDGNYFDVWSGLVVTEAELLRITKALSPSDTERASVEYMD